MAKQQLPTGIWSGFDKKSNGWEDNVNENFYRISAYLNACVIDQVTTLPGSSTDGDTYFKSDTKQIAVWYNGQFNLFDAPCGWAFYDNSNNTKYIYDGTDVFEDTGAPAISSTTGSTALVSNPAADAGKLLITNIDGYVDGSLVPNIPVFASREDFETFYDRLGADGDVYFDSTLGQFNTYNSTFDSGGWFTLERMKSLTVDGPIIMAPGSTGNVVAAQFANEVGFQMPQTGADAIGVTMGSGGANPIFEKYTRPSGDDVGLRGVLISGNSGNLSITSTSYVAVANCSGDLEVTGNRPVVLKFTPGDSQGSSSFLQMFGDPGKDGFIAFFEDGIQVSPDFEIGSGGDNTPLTIEYTHIPTAGDKTYSVSAKMESGSILFQILNYRLVAYEL